MTAQRITALLAATALWSLMGSAQAQAPQYGANISYDQAHKVMVAAMADARKQNIPMAVAIRSTPAAT